MNKENTRAYKVEQIFAQNPNLKVIYVCSDDQAFTQESKADSHAKNLKDQTVESFAAEVAEVETGSILDLSIKKLAEALNEVSDVEVLEALKDEEAAKENPRKGALEALEARILVLNTPADIEVIEPVIETGAPEIKE